MPRWPPGTVSNGLSASVLESEVCCRLARCQTSSATPALGWAGLVDATFRGLTDRPPSQTFFAELYDRFAAPDAWRVFEDVVPTLDALAARGLKLGVISNWDERLRPLLERLKLAGYFEIIVVSREVRASKPARAIFQHAVREAGTAARGRSARGRQSVSWTCAAPGPPVCRPCC